jgi:hypothetical protein
MQEMHTKFWPESVEDKFWPESVEGTAHLGELCVDEIKIKINFNERERTEFI